MSVAIGISPLLPQTGLVAVGTPGPPPPIETLFFFGQSTAAAPVDVSTALFQSFVPVAGTDMTFTITNLIAGQILWLISPANIEISVLRQVLGDIITGDVLSNWTKIEAAGVVGVVSADTYQRGPIDPSSAGEDIVYRATFVAGV